MEIPRFWAKESGDERRPDGQPVRVECWRWSAASVAEAAQRAREALDRVRGRIRAGQPFPDRYEYGSRPLREEIIRELPGRDGETAIILTRNAYGALVMNCAQVMFVDVDDAPAAPPGLIAGLRALFSQRKPPLRESAAIARAKQLASEDPRLGVRVYRTKAGFRLLFTHALFDPTGDAAAAGMERLDADPRYRKLCRVQKSFRARLTPKHWRMGMPVPPRRDPWKHPEREDAMKAWVAQYERESAHWAVCRLVETIGTSEPHPDVAPVVSLHDDLTGAGSARPLA